MPLSTPQKDFFWLIIGAAREIAESQMTQEGDIAEKTRAQSRVLRVFVPALREASQKKYIFCKYAACNAPFKPFNPCRDIIVLPKQWAENPIRVRLGLPISPTGL